MYWCEGGLCPGLDVVDSTGTMILVTGVVTSDDTVSLGTATGMAVRWGTDIEGAEFVRVYGDPNIDLPAGLTYDVEFYDTTFFLPRFNNSATQVTVLVIQNTTNVTVPCKINFYSAAGTLLYTHPLSVPEHGVQVFDSSSIAVLQGQSGSVTIAQSGGYGALAGKGVAVEPGTGFTFDTALTPLQR